MRVSELQHRTNLQLVTCKPSQTIKSAASLLCDERIGALPVVEGGRMVGILSERDVCRCLARRGNAAAAAEVRELMTDDVATCHPDDLVKDAGAIMLKRHIRHLPIVDKGDLVGMISLRDVLAADLDEARLEAEILRDYVRAKA